MMTGSTIEWVLQSARLWTGRLDGRPVGTIEQGRRFVFVDLDGTAHRGTRTLEGAQEAALAHLS